MSTRSGKRIHGSLHEEVKQDDDRIIVKSERKTRSKRVKENYEVVEISKFKSKRRSNYVSYPTDDEGMPTAEEPVIKEANHVRVLRKNTLKEQNLNITNNNNISNTVVETKNSVRQTRRTKKLSENVPDETTGNAVIETEVVIEKPRKKSKRLKNSAEKSNRAENEVEVVTKKKSKRKRKSFSRETASEVKNSTLNKSNTSIDSFHSAAGSPVGCGNNENSNNETNSTYGVISDQTLMNIDIDIATQIDMNVSKLNEKRKNRSSAINKDNSTPNINRISDAIPSKNQRYSKRNSTFEMETANNLVLNSTFEIETETHQKSSLKNTTFDKSDISVKENVGKTTNDTKKSSTLSKLNGTFEKDSGTKRKSLRSHHNQIETVINNTFEKTEDKLVSEKINTTYEKEKLNSTFDKTSSPKLSATSSEETSETGNQLNKINTTFEKENLNTTIDKTNSKKKTDSPKLSVTSDSNLTSDKSDNISRISITSDDSRVENIVNITPVLIESSIDESKMSVSPQHQTQASISTPITPLKRENTFTKEGPDVMTPDSKPTERTPSNSPKSKSLSSPGSTPFPFSKSSQKEKCMLNVTRSIEKNEHKSQINEPAARITKVMFCSPVNNPAVLVQQKRKVIKSNLKGSNKSFVFEESTSSPLRPAPRKRSYTHNDVEDARVKRTRLADDQQQSVDRLSRPRTSTSTTTTPSKPNKPPSTPSKKIPTPVKAKSDTKISRTKLPNFAALHQRRFDKMESLDECQLRKAKRARQLLTPTASISVLDRSTPRDITKEPPKQVKESTKKTDIQFKTQLPTLDNLKPGYNRFGFKLNVGVNPFSIPVKNDKPSKPKGALVKATAPSLNGATTTRRAVAKQLVMREKSFTLAEKRGGKREENRTVIKGVRTNRRFELQMKMRNIT